MIETQLSIAAIAVGLAKAPINEPLYSASKIDKALILPVLGGKYKFPDHWRNFISPGAKYSIQLGAPTTFEEFLQKCGITFSTPVSVMDLLSCLLFVTHIKSWMPKHI